MKNGTKTTLLFLLLGLVTAVIVVAPLRATPRPAFTLVFAAMVLFCILLGVMFQGKALGILITELNTMSLSRLQIVLWTVAILASYITIALARVGTMSGDLTATLMVKIPDSLLALIGISLTSGVGSAFLGTGKMQKEPTETAKGAIAADEAATSMGVLYARKSARDATFADVFEGDELADNAVIDVAKVQMFFFTIVGLTGYVVAVYRILSGNLGGTISLPDLPANLPVLMGMSHAAYLANKLPTRTPQQATQSTTEAQPQAQADARLLKLEKDLSASQTNVVHTSDDGYQQLLQQSASMKTFEASTKAALADLEKRIPVK